MCKVKGPGFPQPTWTARFKAILDAAWENQWFGAGFIVCTLALAIYLLIRVPAPGISAACMATVAALVAGRTNAKGIEKAVWMFLICLFLICEIRAIHRDRDESNDHFVQTISGITATLNMETGGDSFCYVSFIPFDGPPSHVQLSVTPVGKFPLRNVQLNITDSERMHRIMNGRPSGPMEAGPYGMSTIPIRAGDLNVDSAVLLWPDINAQIVNDKLAFTVMFRSLSKTWFEFATLRRVNGQWKQAIQIQSQDKNTPIWERVDNGYPLINSQVDWPP